MTPAHDPNDYEVGMRHKLEFINILNDDGTMNANAGPVYQVRFSSLFQCGAVADKMRLGNETIPCEECYSGGFEEARIVRWCGGQSYEHPYLRVCRPPPASCDDG